MACREGAHITQRKQSALLLIDRHETGVPGPPCWLLANPAPKRPQNPPVAAIGFSGVFDSGQRAKSTSDDLTYPTVDVVRAYRTIDEYRSEIPRTPNGGRDQHP